MTPLFLLLVTTVALTLSSQPPPPYANAQQGGSGLPNYFYQPNYGLGQGGFPFSGQYYNQYTFPQMQYPSFYGGSYNGMPFGGASATNNAQSPVAPGGFPFRESTVVETITPNQGLSFLGNPPPTGMMPQGIYQPNTPVTPQPPPPSIVQSNTVLEPDTPNPSQNPGHYEFYQYGRDGIEAEERKLHGGIIGADQSQRRIQHPFSVQKRPHYELYKYARIESSLFTP